MAPFTSSKSLPFNNASCSGGVMLEEQAKDVIATFFASLAVYLSGVETHKVNGTGMGHPKFFVYTMLCI